MDDETFEALVVGGIEALPGDIRAQMKNVAIVISDEPDAEQREKQKLHDNETLFGLYEGIPQTERGLDYDMVLPDKITIFKLPILDAYSDPEDIKTCVANTVWHEIAHHFGMDEEEVGEEEIRRGKTL